MEQEAGGDVPLIQTLQRAEQALAQGDDSSAERLFNQVLNSDPINPKANTGIGLLNLLKANRKLLTLMESVSTELGTNSRGSSSLMRLINFDYSQIQRDLTDIVIDLENAKNGLEIALTFMSPDSTMTVYPNRFDWNKDGYTDAASPLNLSFDLRGDGETRLWWVLFDRPAPAIGPRRFFDSSKRGDAWFDIQTINGLIYEDSLSPNYSPDFDEKDHIILSKNEIEVILGFVNLELSVLEPTIIYDLNPKPEFTDFLTTASNTMHQYAHPLDFATQTLDTDQNGTMTNTEIRTNFPETFLRFYSNQQGGVNAVNDWKDALNDLVNIGLKLEREGFFEFTRADVKGFFEAIDKAVNTESNYLLKEGGIGEDSIYIKPSIFFSNPENFDDLKDLLIPDIGYLTFNIQFPDPTFGGLINQTPVLNLLRQFNK